jgi:hypothetical protein
MAMVEKLQTYLLVCGSESSEENKLCLLIAVFLHLRLFSFTDTILIDFIFHYYCQRWVRNPLVQVQCHFLTCVIWNNFSRLHLLNYARQDALWNPCSPGYPCGMYPPFILISLFTHPNYLPLLFISPFLNRSSFLFFLSGLGSSSRMHPLCPPMDDH